MIKKEFLIFKTIRTKLLLAFFLVGLFPLCVLSFIYYQSSSESMHRSSVLSLERGAMLAAQDLEEYLNFNLRNVWAQSQLPIFSEYIKASQTDRFRLESHLNTTVTILLRNESTYLKSFYILDAQGRFIFDSTYRRLGLDCVNCNFFKLPITSASPQVQLFSNERKEWELHFSTPVRDSSGHITGVFGVSYGLSVIQRLMKKYHEVAGAGTFVLVVDGQDRLISFLNDPSFIQRETIVAESLSQNLNKIEIDHRIYLGIASNLNMVPWKVWTMQPVDVFKKIISERLVHTSLAILVIMLLTFLVFILTERWIAYPVRKLSDGIKIISKDENLKGRVVVIGHDEISLLGREFNLLLEKIEIQMSEIRDKEQSFRVLFEFSPDPLLVIHNQCFVDCNPAALKLLKVKFKEDLIGVPPSDISPARQFDGRESENAMNYYLKKVHEEGVARFEWIHKRSDESLFFVEVHLALITLRGEQMVLCTWRDIEERKKAERDKEIMLRELEAKTKEMESIVYVSSHDLRSPLVNVLGFSQRLEKLSLEINEKIQRASDLITLKNDLLPLLNERMPSMIRFIQSSGKKMDTLINGLLKLSRTGRVPLNMETIDMKNMIQTILDSHEFMIDKIGAKVILEELPPCEGDYGQVNQIFSNLIDNALKYAEPQRQLVIKISGSLEGGHKVIYKVQDTGKGIPKDHQDKIWNLFHRLDPLGPVQGEGIGLTLTHKIAERHGGKMWVESEPGLGSTFFVELSTMKG